MFGKNLLRKLSIDTVRRSSKVLSSMSRRHSSTRIIVCRTVVPDDDEQIRSLFFNHYFPSCTMGRLLDIKVPDECERMVDRLSSVSRNGWSVVAEDAESKMLLGVIIAYLVDFPVEHIIMPCPLSDLATEKEKIFADFMDNHLHSLYKGQATDWFIHHEVKRFIRGYQATVHKDVREKGILREMMVQWMRNASERGVYCCVGEAGNPTAKKATGDMGFEELSKLFVADYKYKGEQLFGGCGDASMTLMGKVISERNFEY